MLQPHQYIKLSPLWMNKCLKNKKEWRRERKTCPRIKTSLVRQHEERTLLREMTLMCHRLKVQPFENQCEKILEALKIQGVPGGMCNTSGECSLC